MVVVAFPERKWQWLRERVCLVRENARGQSGGSQKRERARKECMENDKFPKRAETQTDLQLLDVCSVPMVNLFCYLSLCFK